MSRRREALAVSAILALALGLRLLGIRLGLPWYHHWDEGWVTGNAVHMIQTPAWEPQVYEYGAPLSMLMDLTVRACGALFPSRVFDPTDGVLMHLVGRCWTAALSTSGALATYLAARWATPGDRGALARGAYAGLGYACAAELVSHGRYAVTDACLVAMVAWSLAFGARYVRGGRARDAIAMVAAAALAPAFKVTGAPALVVPAVLLVLRRPAGSRRAAIAVRAAALPVAAAVFFAANPHFVLHGAKALADIGTRVHQYEHGGVPEFLVRRRGLDHLGAVLGLLAFRSFHRWPAASAILAASASLGLARALALRNRTCVAGVLAAAAVVLGLSITSRAFLARNYLVALPVLCVGLGFALEWAGARLRERVGRGGPVAFAACFGAIYVVVPIHHALLNQALAVDARERAIDWIARRHRGQYVTVACTPEIARDAESDDRNDLRVAIARPEIRFAPDVRSVADVRRERPDVVLDVSQPDPFGRGDAWRFTAVPGYREEARFDANPWEHDFDVTPTWMGRFHAVVLERQRE